MVMEEVKLSEDIKHLDLLVNLKRFRIENMNFSNKEEQELENLEKLILRLKTLEVN